MRFILLKSDDLPMFTKELDLDEHVFYLRHQDGFRQMYKSQGKDFWVRFVLSFRSAQGDVLSMLNGKVKGLADYLDSFYIIIHEEFVEGPFSRARQFFENTVTILLDENAASLYRFLSIVKSPFCRRETKHIYQTFFGNHGDPISFAKAIVMYPLFGRFAGALCICLRRWVRAKEMDDPSDTSYWVQPPAASDLSPSSPDHPSASPELPMKSDKHDKLVSMFLEDYLKLQLTMKSKLVKYCPCCQTRLVQEVAASQMQSGRPRDGKSSDCQGEGEATVENLESWLAKKAKREAKIAKKKLEARKMAKAQRSPKVVCDDSDHSAEDDAWLAPSALESCCGSHKARGDQTSRRNPTKSKKSLLEDKQTKFMAGDNINKDKATRKKKKNRSRGQAKDRQQAKEDNSDIGSGIVKSDVDDVERPANCKTSKSETFEMMKSSLNNIQMKSNSSDSCTRELRNKETGNSTQTLEVPEKTTDCARFSGVRGGNEASGFDEAKSLERQMLGLRLVPQKNSVVGTTGRQSRGRNKHSCTCCGLEEPVPKTFKICRRCKDEGVGGPPFYCSRDCQIQDWNAHRQQYHEKSVS